MALSLIKEIELKPTPTEAWTMRFRVTTKNPATSLKSIPSDHIFRLGNKDWTLDQVLAQAQELIGNWFKQELLANLSSYVKEQVTGKDPLDFTLVTAAKVSDEPLSTSSWVAKMKKGLSSGTDYICKDVDSAVEALGKIMGVEQSSMRSRNMTLLYPIGYAGQMYEPQKKLEHSYPQLKLLPRDYLVTSNTPFALLLCNDEAAAKIGTFELHDKIKLFRDDENPDFTTYILAFPSYSLDILAPEQIAVLTGI